MSVPYELEETSAGWLVKKGNSVIAIREREASKLNNYDLIELNRYP